jgi:hypothetical protein
MPKNSTPYLKEPGEIMLENTLLAAPTSQWLVDQVIVLDWYDGPRGGLCALAHPVAEFFFEFVDEIYNPDGLDMRIMRLKEISAGSTVQLASELTKLGLGAGGKPIWAPVWIFPTEAARDQAETLIKTLESHTRLTDLLISSADMKQITACWKLGSQRPTTVALPNSFDAASEPARQLE